MLANNTNNKGGLKRDVLILGEYFLQAGMIFVQFSHIFHQVSDVTCFNESC